MPLIHLLALMAVILNDLPPQRLFKRCAQVPPDENAWREFLRRYGSDLSVGICRVIGFPPDPQYSRRFEEILARVYLHLLEKDRHALVAFRGQSELEAGAFLRQIAVRVALNAVRRTKIETVTGGEIPEMPMNDPEVGKMMRKDEVNRLLEEKLHGRNKFRNMLLCKLCFYDGLGSEQIGEILGRCVTVRAIENEISRTRGMLRDSLEGDS